MFDVKKFVDSILFFVNFFVVRIAVACLLAGLMYRMSGQHYFGLAVSYISNIPLNEQDLKSYVAKASEYVTEGNVKNAIFVVTLIVCLSFIDILYRIVGWLGKILPVAMLYNYRYATDRYQPVILGVWRRYAKKYEPYSFIALVEDRAIVELWKIPAGWWRTFFDYLKSFIVIMILVYILTPHSALKVSLLDIAIWITAAVFCMALCTAIESARIVNHMSTAVRKATETLSNEAEDAPITEDEYKEATKDIGTKDGIRPWYQDDWRGKFTCVTMTIIIPYIASAGDLLRAYRTWRREKGYRSLG